MSGKKSLIMAVLLVAVVALMAGCAGQSNTVKTGDNVSVDYALWVGDNTSIIETSNVTIAKQAGIYDESYVQYMESIGEAAYMPLTFVVGNSSLLSDFQNAIIGMKVGETKNITIQPSQEIYGIYDPSLIQPANMSDVTSYLHEVLGTNETPYVNQTFVLYDNYGSSQMVRVDSIQINESNYNNSSVYIDYNHPLASKVLHFMITLRSINSASPSV
jgi:peptidylprolyl isomerase